MLQSEKIIKDVKTGDFSVRFFNMELTRKCGFNCGHCFHGKLPTKEQSPNLNMPQDTIEAIFDRFQNNELRALLLTGGEQSDDLSAFERFTQVVQQKKPKFGTFAFVTNGANVKDSKNFFELVNDIAEQSANKRALITLSNDFYHRKEYEKRGLDYCEHAKELSSTSKKFPKIRVKKRRFFDNSHLSIVNLGNARLLDHPMKESIEDSEWNEMNLEFYKYRGKTRLGEISFDCNGSITKGVQEYCDPFNFGNIHTDDMTQILLQHGHER